MKKIIGMGLFSFLSIFGFGQSKNIVADYNGKEPVYKFTVKDISGKDFNFSDLRGKKILIVNTASKCGLTPQYKDLETLYETYKDKNFIIIGFPANNFLKQEPGSDSTIAEFCQLNYGVTFPMMSKISVKGADIHPLYSYLTSVELNGYTNSEVGWNFQKYAINEQGFLVGIYAPTVSPMAKEIIEWIEK